MDERNERACGTRSGVGIQHVRVLTLVVIMLQGSPFHLAAQATQAASDNASQVGGTKSVGGTLTRDEEITKGATELGALGRALESYSDFKARVKSKYGFSLGGDYNATIQYATESLAEDVAAGGVLRLFGQWTLVGRESGSSGSLIFKVENRHRLGTAIPPQQLGFEAGYAGLTSVGFSDIGWALTNLYWEQGLLDGRVAFVAGVVDTTDYVDTYSLVDPWTAFSNLAFSTNPTIAAPNQGLGATVRVSFAENFYVLGGLADANGEPTDPGGSIRSFFDEAEYFTHVEVGWAASFARRFTDSVHLTAWHADARMKAQTPAGWGLAFSANRLIQAKWAPFLRAGYSDKGGALWAGSAGGGLGRRFRGGHDQLGAGLSWGRPSESTFGPGLRDQYTVELFYRLQLSRNIMITPDVQFLINPALSPDRGLITVFGLRARFGF